MSDRKVRLVIEIDDKDVKDATSSLEKMGLAVKKAGDGGAPSVEQLGGVMRKATAEGELLGRAAEKAFELVTEGAREAVHVVLEVSKSFAEYGDAIDKAKQITGLHSEELSGLFMQARRVGISYNDLGEGIKTYTKLIGDANSGSKTAEDRMTRLLGSNWKARSKDLDDALRDVFARLVTAPNEIQATNIALAAFGDQGAKLVPFVKSFHGNIDELIKKARELGVVMSDDDVRSAKEFEEATKDLQEAWRGVAITFGRELAPVVKQTFDDMNRWLQQNKREVTSWADWVAKEIKRALNPPEPSQGGMAAGAGAGFFGTSFQDWALRRTANRFGIAGGTPRDKLPGSATPEEIEAFRKAEEQRSSEEFQGRLANMSRMGSFWGSPEEKKAKEKKAGAPRAEKADWSPEMRSFESALRRLDPALRANILDHARQAGIPDALALAQIFSESTFHTAPAPHDGVYGLTQMKPETASRALHRRVTGAQLENPNTALEGWAAEMSRLADKYGDWGLAVLAYHQGEGKADQVTAGRGKFGPKGIAYYNKITALSGMTGNTVYKSATPEQTSDQLTKDFKDQLARQALENWKATGLVPDENTAGEIVRLMAEDARKLGKRQLSAAEIQKLGFGAFSLPSTVATEYTPRPLTGPNSRLSEADRRFQDQSIGLGLMVSEDDRKAGRLTRDEELDRKRKYYAQDMLILEKDKATTLQEQALVLRQQLELLGKGNIEEEASVRASERRLSNQTELRDLQIEMMNLGKDDADVIEIARLRTILDLRQKDRDAVIAIQDAQLRLNDALTVSNVQVRAGVYQHIAGARTMSEAYSDGINKTYDAVTRLVNGPLDKLNEKSKGLLSFFTEPMKAMQDQAIGDLFLKVTDKLFPGMGDKMKEAQNPMLYHAEKHTQLLEQIAKNTGGMPAGYTSSGSRGLGGIFSSIFHGGGGGGGMGPGGTPFFNPNSGPQTGDTITLPNGEPAIQVNGDSTDGAGGMFGGFKDLFQPKQNPFTGKMNSKTAGIMGGIGSLAAMVGGFIPGRAGRTLQYAGMGAQYGSMFGPWGAIIGAAAGGLFGLFGHRDDAEQKLKAAAQSQFGVTIDKSTTQALKVLGEGMFGKGKVGANAAAVVGSEEGRNIIQAFAESHGQSTLKLDRLNYGDPNWSGNDFRIGSSSTSTFAGGTMGSGASFSIGGGRSMSAARFAAQTSGGANLAPIMAVHAEAMARIADTLERLDVKPAGVIVREGAPHASDAIADSYHSGLAGDAYAAEDSYRSRGEYN